MVVACMIDDFGLLNPGCFQSSRTFGGKLKSKQLRLLGAWLQPVYSKMLSLEVGNSTDRRGSLLKLG